MSGFSLAGAMTNEEATVNAGLRIPISLAAVMKLEECF